MTKRPRPGIGNRLAPWRFLLFLGVLPPAVTAAAAWVGPRHGLLAGFDAAALAFLVTLPPLFRDRGAEAMRRRAAHNDANRVLMLAITGATMLAVLAAIAAELSEKAAPQAGAVALIVATLAIAWTFSNTVYALHYAHVWYVAGPKGGDRGGLDFPGEPAPGYRDFAYFAFTLGMTFQTSDVAITGGAIRTTALFHSLAAFVFNLGVVAFTVNILGG